MFKIKRNKEIGNKSFKYFKPDLDLKDLILEARHESELFYEINN